MHISSSSCPLEHLGKIQEMTVSRQVVNFKERKSGCWERPIESGSEPMYTVPIHDLGASGLIVTHPQTYTA